MHGLTETRGRRRRGTAPSGARRPGVVAFLTIFGLLLLALSPLTAISALAQGDSAGTIVARDDSTASAAQSDWSPPRTVYIPETGHTIDGVFLDFWREAGGVFAHGYPITPELEENGRIVQYYGYARFEYWPEDPNGNIVQVGNIGEELRPHVVRRGLGPFGSGADAEAADAAARMARAWLPLDESFAENENTDTWRYVPETRHSVQFGFKHYWEAIGGAGYIGNPLTEEYVLDGVTYQVFERGQLAWKIGEDPWLVPIGKLLAKRYKLDTSPIGQGNIPIYSEELWIPPPPPKPKLDPNGQRWIEINLSSQHLVAWQGDVPYLETYVSTGRPGFDTPTGTFYISYKLETEDMEGVIGGEYYNVPAVPWTMYFTYEGHAIHGAYWHSNFGAVMSHGCVNLPVDVAAALYNWAPSGTRIEISF